MAGPFGAMVDGLPLGGQRLTRALLDALLVRVDHQIAQLLEDLEPFVAHDVTVAIGAQIDQAGGEAAERS